MVTAVKHGLPRTIMNNSPFYITTNEVPNFGNDEENVKRRIAVFETKSLPQTIPGAYRWMYDHAMDCLVWLASEIDAYRELIEPEELWYEEDANHEQVVIDNNEGLKLFNRCALETITKADLEETDCSSQI